MSFPLWNGAFTICQKLLPEYIKAVCPVWYKTIYPDSFRIICMFAEGRRYY